MEGFTAVKYRDETQVSTLVCESDAKIIQVQMLSAMTAKPINIPQKAGEAPSIEPTAAVKQMVQAETEQSRFRVVSRMYDCHTKNSKFY